MEHLDVLIVGAGLSGIGAAHHLQRPPAAEDLRHPRGPRHDRRDLGPVPLSGRALGLGHVDARVSLPALDRGEDARRRPFDPRLRPRDGSESGVAPTSATATTSPPPRRPTPTPAGPSASRGGELTSSCNFLHDLRRLLPLRRRATAGLRRPSSVPGPDRPPAVLARGPRLRRQAGGRRLAAGRPRSPWCPPWPSRRRT